ncbi:MFS transporter [Gordonia sp. CPCC 205333]|uniref:MFS transporter n=1 Tax=Gordonia sp. CPCC 205333 TaxID=3140790 RepID=UPI003AF36F55
MSQMISLDKPGLTEAATYRRASLALFAAGLATFATLYYVQGLLPIFSSHFGVSPASSALAVSVTTALLAIAIVPASVASERYGRVRVMCVSVLAATLLGLVLPWSPTFEVLLAGRALQGLLCAGVPAVAMAYLAEELSGNQLGNAMGLYVAGTTLGGLLGRIVPAVVVDLTTWQWALEAAAVVALGCAVVFTRTIPESKHFVPKAVSPIATVRQMRGLLADRVLVALVGLAFVLMGGFVTVYNFLGYRLLAAPFGWPSALVGLVFLLYLAGTVSSALSGRLTERFGRPRVLWACLILMGAGLLIGLPDKVAAIIVGTMVFTAAFFGAHSVASSWVGARVDKHRAQASSLYLLGYYLGSSIVGACGGWAYAGAGWAGIVGYVGALLIIAAMLAAVLTRSTGSHSMKSHSNFPDSWHGVSSGR